MLWLDLETTGTNERVDEIVEVGIALTDRDLNIIDERSWVVPLTDPAALFMMDDVVIDMHQKSGLLGDILKANRMGRPGIAGVDEAVAKVLYKYNGTRHTPLAGSGVMHFDRRFIKRYMPKTDKALTFWAYDVGVVRRFMKMAGIRTPDNFEALKHRALDDVHDHIDEAKVYLDLMKNMFEQPND
jgi:oligoribonuclease